MRHCAERHRADAGQRVSFPPVESDDESGERKTGPRPRIPSSAIACIAQYRSRYLTPEAVAMVKAMDADTAKETCLNVLKALGFIVTLRTPANPNRNRSWEMRRSAMRAKARAEKAALKMAQIHAEDTKPLVPAVEIQADSAL